LKDVGYGYLPFNGGQRVSPGREFILLEVGCMVTKIFQRFLFIAVLVGDPIVEIGKEKQALYRVHLRQEK
jgi:cytochrome P450